MLFSSLVFLAVFLPCVLSIYYLLLRNNRKLQNVFLFLSSLFFYAWGEPYFVFVMLLSVTGNFFFGILVDKHRAVKSKAYAVIAAMLVFNLSIIFVFKYLAFTMENLNLLLHKDMTIIQFALPIGISFFTFQSISYVIDIYHGKGQVQKSWLTVGLYIAFFPALIAGPIIRYETISDQLMNRKENFDDFSSGVCRFIIGLGKKVLLANNFAIIADQSFAMASTDSCSMAFAWLGALAYTFQIFFDFSGYSDMAIGLGKMFGFKLPENFNYPYISKSASEFWRRWHISLGTWFRDYVYIPLGGSRVDKARLVFNLFVVWSLTGLWHGANWTFIFWGLLYFVFLTFEKLTNFEKRNIPTCICYIYTMLLVIFGWVLFRSNTIGDAANYITIMLGMSGQPVTDPYFWTYLKENFVFYIFAVIFSVPTAKWVSEYVRGRFKETNPALVAVYCTLFLGVTLICISYLVKGAYNPFIYFNF